MNNSHPKTKDDLSDSLRGRYITFTLGDEVYAFEIKYVNEIIGIQKITNIPKTEDYVEGIINLRGQIAPIINLRKRFMMQVNEFDERTCIIIVNSGSGNVGMIVDEVSEVVSLDDTKFTSPPKSGKKTRSRFLKALSESNGKVRIILDIEKTLFD